MWRGSVPVADEAQASEISLPQPTVAQAPRKPKRLPTPKDALAFYNYLNPALCKHCGKQMAKYSPRADAQIEIAVVATYTAARGWHFAACHMMHEGVLCYEELMTTTTRDYYCIQCYDVPVFGDKAGSVDTQFSSADIGNLRLLAITCSEYCSGIVTAWLSVNKDNARRSDPLVKPAPPQGRSAAAAPAPAGRRYGDDRNYGGGSSGRGISSSGRGISSSGRDFPSSGRDFPSSGRDFSSSSGKRSQKRPPKTTRLVDDDGFTEVRGRKGTKK